MAPLTTALPATQSLIENDTPPSFFLSRSRPPAGLAARRGVVRGVPARLRRVLQLRELELCRGDRQ
jgi:hypothetical protein